MRKTIGKTCRKKEEKSMITAIKIIFLFWIVLTGILLFVIYKDIGIFLKVELILTLMFVWGMLLLVDIFLIVEYCLIYG